jgi:hypothetical protein
MFLCARDLAMWLIVALMLIEVWNKTAAMIQKIYDNIRLCQSESSASARHSASQVSFPACPLTIKAVLRTESECRSAANSRKPAPTRADA